jgi:glycosyltransferase involved in cell wall biosynthesis
MNRNRLRVVYFTRVPLNEATNGGHLCCRNHLNRLNGDTSLNVTAVASGPAAAEAGTREFLRTHGINGHFIPYKPVARDARGAPPRGALPWTTYHWPFLDEVEAKEQSHIDEALKAHVIETNPDCVLIDYLPSAYFVPSLFSMRTPVVTITLNREADFYQDMIRHKIPLYGYPTNRVAGLRLRCTEALIHWRSRAVVTIGRYDSPRRIFGRPLTFWVAPFMDPKPDPWVYSGSRSLFFVGNHLHFPNRDAIEWLATKFAPELATIAPSIRLKIVGAERTEVPEAWRRQNVDYLGVCDQPTLKVLFQSEAALIAPISNNFGAKYKIVEAVAYGTPLLAPESAMSGIPFLPSLTRIELGRPRDAALAAQSLIYDADAQRLMSAKIREAAAEFIRTQDGIWGRLLRAAVLGRHHSSN